MLEQMHQYYVDEKSGFVYAVSAGAIFLLASVVLWLRSAAHPISRGLAVGLVIASAVLIVGGFATRYYNDQKIREVAARQAESEMQLRQSEIQRMHKVMNVTFRYAFFTFAGLITALVLVIILSKSYSWKGFAMAFTLLILLVLIFDTYNAKRNAEYLNMLLSSSL